MALASTIYAGCYAKPQAGRRTVRDKPGKE